MLSCKKNPPAVSYPFPAVIPTGAREARASAAEEPPRKTPSHRRLQAGAGAARGDTSASLRMTTAM
ncbi:MAG: hypothetical protein LBO71_06980 [Prevotellaceae bacterium]|nr:hypothetical protein [Prevotellaceae bacterium]